MPGGRNSAARTIPDFSRDLVVAELGSALFSSFAREDQRRKGVEYLNGLLRAGGRKSIRNIAQAVGGPGTEQYLHHFISDSTWGWVPVRRALAEHVRRVAEPDAWVVRPMLIPKAGKHSVGVARRFCPELGQTLNAQQAMGVWAASDDVTVPVDWRLHLSQAWVQDPGRRSRAAIPDWVRAETEGECAIEAFLGMDARLDFPDRPLVLDARGMDVHAAVARLHPTAPLLMRISGTQAFTVLDPAVARRGAEPLPARQIMGMARETRKPVAGRWPLLAATVRVGVPGLGGRTGDPARVGVGQAGALNQPGRAGAIGPADAPSPGSLNQAGPAAGPVGASSRGARVGAVGQVGASGQTARIGAAGRARVGELVLLGVGSAGQSWPAELWLSNQPDADAATLLHTSRFIDRVDHDFARFGDRVGLRDFTGRSFAGWHRHTTLASAAHAVLALADSAHRGGWPSWTDEPAAVDYHYPLTDELPPAQ
ncbi:IS701 family transposase [Saccharothrix saharensis]|uniref:IS701 family transposase n=1 Tax=Saccharothrix saharensis TaxID=571190 RepID=UPI0036947D77